MKPDSKVLEQVAGIAPAAAPPPRHPEDFLVAEARTMRQLGVMANAMSASGFFDDVQSTAQALTKMIIGMTLNIGPVQAMMGISIVKGKPMLSANLLASIVRQHPRYDYRVIETTADACAIEFLRDGEPCGVSRFTMADAKRAGLESGTNWKHYPAAMLYARAMSQGCRWFAPDVFSGIPVYAPGELPGGKEETGPPPPPPDDPPAHEPPEADADGVVLDVEAQDVESEAEAIRRIDEAAAWWRSIGGNRDNWDALPKEGRADTVLEAKTAGCHDVPSVLRYLLDGELPFGGQR